MTLLGPACQKLGFSILGYFALVEDKNNKRSGFER